MYVVGWAIAHPVHNLVCGPVDFLWFCWTLVNGIAVLLTLIQHLHFAFTGMSKEAQGNRHEAQLFL
jgi:hypothetical protein